MKDVALSALSDETELSDTIVNVSTDGFPTLKYEEFKALFPKVARFYTKSGLILLSYFNVFRAVASKAMEHPATLSLKLFDDYMMRLVELKAVTISTSGRGTKYIKTYKRLKLL